MSGLSAEQVAHYHEHGWLAPVDVMGESEAAAVLGLLEAAEQQHPDDLHAEHRNNAHLAFPFLAELALDDRIVDAAESIVGPDISLWSTVLFIKEPGSDGFVSWHQDAFYMGLDSGDAAPRSMVTAWLALSESTRQSGCVSVLPGTHTGRAEHHDTFAEHNILTRGQTVSDVDESSAVDLMLRPGQMSFHHPWLIHGSRPNRTANRRVGIAFQSYMGPGVRPVSGEHHVLPIRGAAPDERFTVVEAPTAELTPSAVATRASANAALSAVLYDGASRRRNF